MRQPICVLGLGHGDEGKGSIVDAIVRKTGATLVVRFNGGANCGHNVVLPDGTHHCFSQIGSGTFAGAATYLGPHVMIDPLALDVEAKALAPTLGHHPLVMIDARAPVLTPWHRRVNRLRELARGYARHGSCGMGIGELGSDVSRGMPVIRARDIRGADLHRIATEVQRCNKWKPIPGGERFAAYEPEVSVETWVEAIRRVDWQIVRVEGSEVIANHEIVVFEGAQGILLDEWHGIQPHTTWSDCTDRYAEELLREIRSPVPLFTIGVTRTYATRHGAGPLATEDPTLRVPGHEHNTTNDWQGAFRLGYFDRAATQYAVSCCPIDGVAVTHMDAIASMRPWWDALVGSPLEIIKDTCQAPIVIESAGPTHEDKWFTSVWHEAMANYATVAVKP